MSLGLPARRCMTLTRWIQRPAARFWPLEWRGGAIGRRHTHLIQIANNRSSPIWRAPTNSPRQANPVSDRFRKFAMIWKFSKGHRNCLFRSDPNRAGCRTGWHQSINILPGPAKTTRTTGHDFGKSSTGRVGHFTSNPATSSGNVDGYGRLAVSGSLASAI